MKKFKKKSKTVSVLVTLVITHKQAITSLLSTKKQKEVYKSMNKQYRNFMLKTKENKRTNLRSDIDGRTKIW